MFCFDSSIVENLPREEAATTLMLCIISAPRVALHLLSLAPLSIESTTPGCSAPMETGMDYQRLLPTTRYPIDTSTPNNGVMNCIQRQLYYRGSEP